MDEVFTNRHFNSASEITVQQLMNILSDAAFICDNTGRIIECSDQVLPFFDISSKTKVIGSSIQSYIAYEHIEEAYFLFLSVVNETNGRKSGIFPVKKGSRETFFSEINFASVAGSESTNKYVLVTFHETATPDKGLKLLHKKDVRLSRLFEAIIRSSNQPIERAQRILSQIGETLGATACSYSITEKSRINPYASWESPYNSGISPYLCQKQTFDYLTEHNENLVVFHKPLLSALLDSERVNTEESGIKTILGFSIVKNNIIEGVITAVFTLNYSLSPLDRQFIDTIITFFENAEESEKSDTKPSEYSFRQLLDCFTDPVYVLSHDGIIMDVNKGISRSYGYEREELIGQTPVLLSAEGKNDEKLIREMFVKAFDGESQHFEWWGQRKNGEIFPIEINFNKSKYYDRDVIIAIGRDLTESKKVEKELTRYNKELIESNVSKDKFFGILAHDLKNPFQGLLGFIDLLYEDLDELSNAQIKEYLSNVRTASYHTYALLENLLEWSRIQSGKMPFTPVVFNISDEINSVISILDNNATRKEIKLINEVDAELMVEADRNMIHSVIQNLITNSIKFSNSKGRVVVRSRVPQKYTKSKITTESSDRQWLEVSISDNGIGIPEEILPKLFKLNGQYSQAGTANEPGTGLGLVLCHEMVEKNGGRIWAESIAGQGTTFIFTIPLSGKV